MSVLVKEVKLEWVHGKSSISEDETWRLELVLPYTRIRIGSVVRIWADSEGKGGIVTPLRCYYDIDSKDGLKFNIGYVVKKDGKMIQNVKTFEEGKELIMKSFLGEI